LPTARVLQNRAGVISIIGIGSPFGDDSAGLEAARRLSAAPPAGATVVVADRPGAGLLDLLEGADAAILIDAIRSGARPGSLRDVDLRRAEAIVSSVVSSHELGVAEALALARALGRFPSRGRFLGIEAAREGPSGPRLDPAVERGVDRAVARARHWTEVLAGRRSVRRSVARAASARRFPGRS
jgi:hydrogenase maturation protease